MIRFRVKKISIFFMGFMTVACTDTNGKSPNSEDTASELIRDTVTHNEIDAGTDSDSVEAHFSVDVQLASDVNPNAPGTVGIVTWSVDVEVTSAFIEFGLDTDYGMIAPVDLNETDYRTLLLGMKPNREYHFRIVAKAGENTFISDDFTVETGPVTNLVNLEQFDVINPGRREPGFILTAYYQTNFSPDGQPEGSVAFIVDQDGEIVWWYQTYASSICRARMSADGKNMWISNLEMDSGLERVTMDTLNSQIYDVGPSQDITPVTGELMAYIDYRESDCSSIFEIDPSGNTVEVFESEGLVPELICGGNALRYSITEDVYTFSDQRSDILVIERTGEVSWRLSDIVPEGWGGAQHGHHLLEKSFLFYANNGGKGGSAATEYTLDGTLVLHYNAGYSTYNLGDVQRLPRGNTLVTFSTAAIIHEISPEGDLLMVINTGGPIGYTSWRKSLYGLPEDIQL
jgi:hypothetical protein